MEKRHIVRKVVYRLFLKFWNWMDQEAKERGKSNSV